MFTSLRQVPRPQLMWQRIDARNGKPEVRIEFVGDSKGIGLQAEPDQFAVASIGWRRVLPPQRRDLLVSKRHPAKDLALDANQAKLSAISADRVKRDNPHRLAE